MELSNGALIHRPGNALRPADVTVTLTRSQLLALLSAGKADGVAIDDMRACSRARRPHRQPRSRLPQSSRHQPRSTWSRPDSGSSTTANGCRRANKTGCQTAEPPRHHRKRNSQNPDPADHSVTGATPRPPPDRAAHFEHPAQPPQASPRLAPRPFRHRANPTPPPDPRPIRHRRNTTATARPRSPLRHRRKAPAAPNGPRPFRHRHNATPLTRTPKLISSPHQRGAAHLPDPRETRFVTGERHGPAGSIQPRPPTSAGAAEPGRRAVAPAALASASMATPESRLAEAGITLPAAPKPAGSYVTCRSQRQPGVRRRATAQDGSTAPWSPARSAWTSTWTLAGRRPVHRPGPAGHAARTGSGASIGSSASSRSSAW